MAAVIFSANTAEVALSAATAKTVLQVTAPTNQRVKVLRVGIFFDGTSPTAEPVQVRVLRQTTAGTMTSLTPVKTDGSLSETIQSTAQHTASAEPTAGNVLEALEIHPQGGREIIYPFGQEPIIQGGGRLGIELTAPAVVNCRTYMICEE